MMSQVRSTDARRGQSRATSQLRAKDAGADVDAHSEELYKLIEQELEENPALETTDEERIRVITPTPPMLSLDDADPPAFATTASWTIGLSCA
jgi:hypothetical protein